MKKTFKIREGGFKEIQKMILAKAIPFCILAGGVGVFITQYNNNGDYSNLKFLIPLFVCILFFSFFKGIKKQKNLFESYTLTITENEIIREQTDTAAINIPLTDIKSIVKSPKGHFTIKGKSSLNAVGIPSQIEHPEEVERILGEIKPIEYPNQTPFLEKYKMPILIAFITIFASFYVSENKWIIGITGIILTVSLGFSFYIIRMSKNIDNKIKRASWSTIFVLLGIIGSTYFRVFGDL